MEANAMALLFPGIFTFKESVAIFSFQKLNTEFSPGTLSHSSPQTVTSDWHDLIFLWLPLRNMLASLALRSAFMYDIQSLNGGLSARMRKPERRWLPGPATLLFVKSAVRQHLRDRGLDFGADGLTYFPL